MLIRINDTAAIQAALDRVQARARVRTLTAEEVQSIAASMENKLASLGVPKHLRRGSRYEYAERVACNAYARKAFGADTTAIELVRRSRQWYLVSADRVRLPVGQSNRPDGRLAITRAARDNLVAQLVRSLHVVPEDEPQDAQ